MKRVLTLVLLATVSAAPALAQETGQLPRFEALEQQERALEQNRFDSLERQRQREIDRAGLPDSTVSRAERGIRDLDYQREFDRLRLEGELQRAEIQRQRDIANAALPNRRIAPHSSLVVTDPESHILPPAPAGHYYARLDGRFVLVDATSELVVRVLEPQPTDPTADVPLESRPPVEIPIPTGQISSTSPAVIRDFGSQSLPPPPNGHYYARVGSRILLVEAKTERPVKDVGGWARCAPTTHPGPCTIPQAPPLSPSSSIQRKEVIQCQSL